MQHFLRGLVCGPYYLWLSAVFVPVQEKLRFFNNCKVFLLASASAAKPLVSRCLVSRPQFFLHPRSFFFAFQLFFAGVFDPFLNSDFNLLCLCHFDSAPYLSKRVGGYAYRFCGHFFLWVCFVWCCGLCYCIPHTTI